MRYLIILFILLLSWQAKAGSAAACAQGVQCVEEQQLYLSWALGYGERSNPLHNGEELPLVLLPDIYYYGRYWFFDNGKIGSSLAESDNWQLSVLGQFNQEKGYFQKWFGGNLMQFSHNTMVGPSFAEERSTQAVSVRQVNKRPTAFDIGIQLDWFNEHWQAQAILWQDASNTYKGQHASVSIGRDWQLDSGQWQLSAKLNWKSAKLIDTYYGIDNNEPFYLPRYDGRPSWQPELRLSWQKLVSERISLLAFVRYLYLDNAMTQSPLVRSDNVTTWFLGVSYRFL